MSTTILALLFARATSRYGVAVLSILLAYAFARNW